jgi:hypothetical protein
MVPTTAANPLANPVNQSNGTQGQAGIAAALKRHLGNAVYRQLLIDAEQAGRQAGPGGQAGATT